jgi:hypothetical protein
VCSPTRFALMTGRWQYRLARRRRGADQQPQRGSTTLGCRPSIRRCPRCCAARATAPRWSASGTSATRPRSRRSLGLRRVLRPMSGGVDYFTHCDSRGTHDLWQARPSIERRATSPT